MVNGILGKKIGMTEAYGANGEVIPVTLIQAGPCVVTQRKTVARDGYEAVQLGLIEFVKPSRLTRPERGVFEKNNLPPCRLLREMRLAAGDNGETKVGDKVLVDQFKEKDWIDVVGISKGRGFAGFIKRHHFGGGAASHGSMFHRAPGSIGASAFPSRVLKGMRGAGHMGVDKVTVRNLQVVSIDADDNILAVKGAVPGPNGGYVVIRKAVKAPRVSRGSAGSESVNPLKASKKAAGGKKK